MSCQVSAFAVRLGRAFGIACMAAVASIAVTPATHAAVAPGSASGTVPDIAIISPTSISLRTSGASAARSSVDRPIRLAQAAGNQGGGFFGNLFNLLSPQKKPEKKPTAEAIVVPGFGTKKKDLKLPSAVRKKPSGLGGAGASFGGGVESAPAIGKVKREGRYRTLCVRLCDGYYFPISTKVPMSRFNRDKSICESSCGSEAKLFYQADLGGDAANMVDLAGKPYRKLKNAFLYRKQFVPSCRCRPEPWSQSELLRHRGYSRVAEIEELPDLATAMPVSADPDDLAEDAMAGDIIDIAAGEDDAAVGDEDADLALAGESAEQNGSDQTLGTSAGEPSPITVIKPAFADPLDPEKSPAKPAPAETGSITPAPVGAPVGTSDLRARHAVARER